MPVTNRGFAVAVHHRSFLLKVDHEQAVGPNAGAILNGSPARLPGIRSPKAVGPRG